MDRNIIERIAKAAVDAERATGCPAELLAAQCALESGWLKHAPGNNCFGIKAYTGAGRQLLPTTEWLTPEQRDKWLAGMAGRTATLVEPVQTDHRGRNKYTVEDYFAAFATLADCFAKRGGMWDKGPYASHAEAFREKRDIDTLVRGIAPVYATDPKYADTVLSIIHRPDLKTAIEEARAA